MVAREHVTSTAETSLDLISAHKHVVLSAKFTDFLDISGLGNNDTTLTLDRLNEDTSNVRISLEHALQVSSVVVVEQLEARSEGTELLVTRLIVASAGRGDRATPEVTSGEQNNGLVVWDALRTVGPSSHQFASGLVGLTATVHRDEFVIAQQVSNVGAELSQLRVVKGARGKCDLSGLVDKGAQDFGVDVTLVASAVSGKTIDVARTFTVPHVNALATLESHGHRRVVLAEGRLVQIDIELVGAGRREGPNGKLIIFRNSRQH